MNIRQSPEYGRYLEKINWQVGKEKDFQYYVRKIPILGNYLKIYNPPSKISWTLLDKLAKKNHAFAVCVDYSPSKTLQLDLSLSLEKILAQMEKDTRYEIRRAENNKITVKQSTDIETFIDLWTKNARDRGFWVPFKKEIRALFEAFGKNSYLLMAYPDSKFVNSQIRKFPISAALVLISHQTVSYFHAASTPEGRKLAAPSLIIWEAIKLAKNKKCKIFDFEGIIDPRNKITKKWGGFTRFKKGFGGREVENPLAVTKYYNPIAKLLFSFSP